MGQARGNITIDIEECKGCGLCVESCPPKCLELAVELSGFGVHPARYTGEGCTGCGICFYCCPEPGAIVIYRLAPPKTVAAQEAIMRQLCKGNVAVIKGALLAGCRAYYGYPITPASEIAEAAALFFPEIGGTFVQAESETASINMVYGAAAAGVRVMTASSGPGLSLMQEGISYLAGAELPCVIVDVMRAGPGLGNIAPEQSDYFAMVKGGGHGNYRNLVLAPASVQEMAELTVLAFELADKYRNPAIVLADGYIGQVMEPLDLEYRGIVPPEKPWAVKGTAETRKNFVSSIYLEADDLEAHQHRMEAKYLRAQQSETRCEQYRTEDADLLVVGYGIVSRVLRSAVDEARLLGIKVGLFRPITLWPFPTEQLKLTAARTERVLVVELSNGQMVEDVRLALNGSKPVKFYGRVGGNVPSVEELVEKIEELTTALV